MNVNKLSLVSSPPYEAKESSLISVIMPSYNEQEHIAGSISSVHSVLEELGYKHEIIVVDDGSKDGTKNVALQLSKQFPVRVVGYSRNMGKGYALKYGANFAHGQITFFVDSDREIKISQLRHYISELQNADMLVASKRHPGSIYKAPFIRKMLGYGFNILVRMLTGISVSDTQSGLKSFRTRELKKVLPLLSVKKYAFDVELLVVASLMKLRIKELPVEIQMDARFSFKNVMRMLVDLLGITYRLRIKRWYQSNLKNTNAKYNPLIQW